MANYQVIDAYGSVITIQSSVFNTNEHRQIVGASIIGAVPVTFSAGLANTSSVFVVNSVVGAVYRNDTLASILGADTTFRQPMGDAAGRSVIKPFVSDDGALISFSASVTSTSITLIAASVAGKRSYITDFWVSNSGVNTTIFQFRENGTSVIGNTIAPAGGGSNSPGIAVPIRTSTLGMDLSFIGLTATSILYVTVKGYQAP